MLRSYVEFHNRSLLMNKSLLHQQWLANLVRFTRMGFEMGSKWSCNRCVCRGLLQESTRHFCVAFSLFVLLASMWCIHLVVCTQLQSYFILTKRSDFRMIDKLSQAFYAFARCILKWLSVDEIWLPKYVIWSTKLWGLPLRAEMIPFYLNYMMFISFAFMEKPMTSAAAAAAAAAWHGAFVEVPLV